MKKVLTALCFALCASVAIAQTNQTAVKSTKGVLAARQVESVDMTQQHQRAGYTGSIFTKAPGDVLDSFTFSASEIPTTGTLGANDRINGHAVGDSAHSRSAVTSQWHRLADTTSAYLTNPANGINNQSWVALYPATLGHYFGLSNGGDITVMRSAETPDNGYMFIGLLENHSPIGGTEPSDGTWNAWFELPRTIDAADAGLFEVTFYQYYRKFNHDMTWIDYCINNEWYSYEINVKNVDITTNSATRGWKRATMPTAACVDGLKLRFRICSSENGGYCWFVDDVLIKSAPANRLSHVENVMFDGFYGITPENFGTSLVWYARTANTGGIAHHGMQGTINYLDEWNGRATTVTTVDPLRGADNGTIDPGATATFVLDPFGYYNEGAASHLHGWGFRDANGEGWHTELPANPFDSCYGQYASLPTDLPGTNYFYVDVQTNERPHLGDSVTYDTIPYQVNSLQAIPEFNGELGAIWARDNGILVKHSSHCAGLVSSNTFTTDPDPNFQQWAQMGYGQYVTYVTGPNVPTDENGNPWVIKGVQIVPSSETDADNGFVTDPGAVISAGLYLDSVTQSNSVYIMSVTTGAGTYEVTEEDLDGIAMLGQRNYLKHTDGYPVINIKFPKQPELTPYAAFRIGYDLESNDAFSPASGSFVGYYDNDDNGHSFSETEGMEPYDATVSRENRFAVMTHDQKSTQNSSWYAGTEWPMIRMIVGPYAEQPTGTVHGDCVDENGEILFYDEGYIDICEEDYTSTIGTYAFVANPRDLTEEEEEMGVSYHFVVNQMFVNGECIFTNDTINPENFEDGYVSQNVEVLANETLTLSATFMATNFTSINSVDHNVSMTLQPNPATSNVQLTIAGVEGMVEMNIIDMSGRVVSTSKVNAEQTQNINLNGLAKGAYFVRITNSNMTKVEKLIVR